MEFRYLKADEVDARVSRITNKGLSLLLYKDARVDMNILDETVGAENWQNKFYEHKGILFCSLGINTNYNKPELPDRWIWKDDAGVESNTEAEKGNASDARKRSGFAWGIGRELYTAPFIWIPAADKTGTPNYKVEEKNGKPKTDDKFAVTYMRVEDGKIVALNIENKSKRRTVFVYGDIFAADNTNACIVCGKLVSPDFAQKSRSANDGKVYCSKTCKTKDGAKNESKA